MQKLLRFPTDQPSWSFLLKHPTCRPSRFHRVRLDHLMNMQLR